MFWKTFPNFWSLKATGEALSVGSFIDRVAVIAYSTAKQTTLDQYFHK